MTRPIIEFPPFRLDVGDERLWRDGHVIALRPKTFAVLRHLIEHSGRLVTRDELFSAVWAGTAVTNDTLTKSIGELREALGDDRQTPRWIETVARRGYRWLGMGRPAIEPSEQPAPPGTFVGRERELAELAGALDTALGGTRQVVFVAGEPGIGKTTLVDAFVARHDEGIRDGVLLVARGQCIEQHGPPEAYMPVLDAMAQLGTGPARELLAATLRQHAPAWLARLPSLSEAAERPALERATATRERMLRELAVALAALTARVPVVFVLEDVQWSDHATTDLLALLARRREPASLLVLATVRPVDLVVQGHPLADVKAELVRQGHCREVPLELLTRAAVTEYVTARFAPHGLPAAFAALLHRRTEGNPFFVVAALEHLIRDGVLAQVDGRWVLAGDLAHAEATVPESVRDMIERQLEKLDAHERDIVQAASLVGEEFPAPAVAAALGCDPEGVEGRCAALARRGQFLEPAESARWPDGTLAAGFRFRHSLYRTVLAACLHPGRRERLHRLIGERLEAGFGTHTSEIASQLAMHFEEGGDVPRAITYSAKAARRALRRSAPGDAASGFEHAIVLAEALPAGAEQLAERLALTLALGDALHLARGYGSLEVEAVFGRAVELSERLEALPQQFFARSGLVAFFLTRGRLSAARDEAARMFDLADRIPLPVLGLMTNTFAGLVRYLGGELVAARTLFERALTCGTDQPPGTQTDFAVLCWSHLACTLALLGFPTQAREVDARARARARETGPYDETAAAFCSAALAAMLRDVPAAAEAAAAAIELAETQGFPMWLASSHVVHGWAAAVGQGDEAGVTEIRTALAGLDEVGFERDRTFMLGLYGAALAALGRDAEAIATVDRGLARAVETEERCYEAELWRLRGELLRDRPAEASRSLRRAIEVARGQQARWWELRATMSLARLEREQGRGTRAAKMVADLAAWFTEGFDTAELEAARSFEARPDG